MSLLAVDIGSSRTKAMLAGWDGQIVEVHSASTPRQSLEPGERAYPAAAVLGTIEGLIAGLAADHPEDRIEAIVFSCLGTSMVPLDGDGRALGAALAPSDMRPMRGPGLEERVSMPPAELLERTGSDPEVASFLLHFLWWQHERPRVFAKLRRFRSLRGFAVAAFCGADAEDPSWASRTMLVDLETNDWSEAILDAAGLPPYVLPTIEPSTRTHLIRPAVVEQLGLAPGAVVVLGGMDNGCAVLGSVGPEGPGLVDIVGTYEHIAGATDLAAARQVAAAAGAVVHAYPLPGRYIAMTRVPMGELLARAVAGDPRGLDRLLEGVSPTPRGRTMPLDPEAVARALRDGEPTMSILQALLESGAAVLRRFADAWDALGLGSAPVAAIGGGAGHETVLRLKADLLGRPLVTLGHDQGAGIGALRLAAMALRGATPAEACALFDNPITRTIEPHRSARRADQRESRT